MWKIYHLSVLFVSYKYKQIVHYFIYNKMYLRHFLVIVELEIMLNWNSKAFDSLVNEQKARFLPCLFHDQEIKCYFNVGELSFTTFVGVLQV